MSQMLFPGKRLLWMDPAGLPKLFDPQTGPHCCADMNLALKNICEEHAGDPFACPDMLVAYSHTFDEYGLIVHDGGASTVAISHCPWCGSALPASQRDRWFEELAALGFDDPLAQDIPEQYRSAAWRLKER
jgi:hypothetical protein